VHEINVRVKVNLRSANLWVNLGMKQLALKLAIPKHNAASSVGENHNHTSVIWSTELVAPCIEFVSSSLSTRSGWATLMYIEFVLPRNALTVSDCPRILRRNAVRHLESMFSLIRCQSRSVMPNRWIKWPTVITRSMVHMALPYLTLLSG